jgi:O-6-methylguanine DNA methyltransferase
MKGKQNQTKGKPLPSFSGRVRGVVRAIPRGATLSYREVARRAGSPRAFRAVGNVLAKNFDPAIPCHRVIRSNGALGGYNRGTRQKARLLAAERRCMKQQVAFC